MRRKFAMVHLRDSPGVSSGTAFWGRQNQTNRTMRLLNPVNRLWHFTSAAVALAGNPVVVEAKAPFSDYEVQIIAAVLVLEAADQGERGMRAVLHVINNRAGNNPARAIGQVARRKAFSCLNRVTKQRNPDYGPVLRRAMRDPMWPDAMRLVGEYAGGRLGPDFTGGATHFCLRAPKNWSGPELTFIKKIGDHRFYR